jgi:hypothetical protein
LRDGHLLEQLWHFCSPFWSETEALVERKDGHSPRFSGVPIRGSPGRFLAGKDDRTGKRRLSVHTTARSQRVAGNNDRWPRLSVVDGDSSNSTRDGCLGARMRRGFSEDTASSMLAA